MTHDNETDAERDRRVSGSLTSKLANKLRLREDKVNTYAPWTTLTTPGGQWHLYLHTPIVCMKDVDPATGKCWSNYIVLPSVEQK